jgi:pseudouridine kinase
MTYQTGGATAEHRVLVVGAAGLDLKIVPRTDAAVPERSNPATIHWGWGGVARNMAENLARLGAEVHLITAVGDDWWGHALLRQLQELGINTHGSIISRDQPTASYAALYNQDKRLSVAFDDMSVTRKITAGHLNRLRSLVRDAEIVCLDANLSPHALKTLFRLTAEYEVPVCADPTAALLAHRLQPYLTGITAMTPDLAEAEALLGETLGDDEAISLGARRLVQAGVDLAIITLGAEGLYYATNEESGRISAFPVDVVDPIGAGDALTAAVAYGLSEKISFEEVVRLGMAAAAQTVACRDAVCSYLSLELLYERLVT